MAQKPVCAMNHVQTTSPTFQLCSSVGIDSANVDRSETCQNGSMSDQREINRAIMPIAATHKFPGRERYMREADLPVDDPDYRSAIQNRVAEEKKVFDHKSSEISMTYSSRRFADFEILNVRLARSLTTTTYLNLPYAYNVFSDRFPKTSRYHLI
ncbi:hypothetical protein MFRU_009g01100 [Monilinia fructicola]|nr:hypothetical protein MFRU_009g01100 [Monilinia fructicola]